MTDQNKTAAPPAQAEFFFQNAAWQADLPMGQKMILLALADIARAPDKSRCWPKVETLATLVGGKVRAVQGYLQDLERSGIIRRDGYYNRRTVFQLTDPQQWPRLVWSGAHERGAETSPPQNLRGAESAGVGSAGEGQDPQNLRGSSTIDSPQPRNICALSPADSAHYPPQNLHPLNHPVKPPSKTTKEESKSQAPFAALTRASSENDPGIGGNANAVKPGTRKPKARQRPPAADSTDGWPAFWAAYPRKVAKAKAEKAWTKLAPDAELCGAIMRGLAAQLPGWALREIQFTPHAATWLNGERWTDEVESASTAGAGTTGGLLPRETRTDEEITADLMASAASAFGPRRLGSG